MTEQEKLIFGFGETDGIVAIEQISPNQVKLYLKNSGKVTSQVRKFYPFYFLSDDSHFPEFQGKYWKKRLNGSGKYKYLFAFENWNDMMNTLWAISKKLGLKRFNFNELHEVYLKSDPISQFLIQSGETYFKSLKYDDLTILFLRVEYSKNLLNRGDIERNFIYLISLLDNSGWAENFIVKDDNEKSVLDRLINVINDKNPDLIIGFNISNQDLPFLISRYSNHRIDFSIGRDGSNPIMNASQLVSIGEYTFNDILIEGRHVIDLFQLAVSKESLRRELQNETIYEVIKLLGLNIDVEICIPEEKKEWYLHKDIEILMAASREELGFMKLLSELMVPIHFYEAQMIPMNFLQLFRSGVSHKIELLMVREYLRKKYSLPEPMNYKPVVGGYSDVFYRGLFNNIIHADIESLYPSIIISNKISPKSDVLNVFLKLVEVLTRKRLELKHQMLSVESAYKKSQLDAMQKSYKILINSFYGYLGFARGIFNDYDKANEITTYGQKLLKILIEEFKKRDCLVLEVDTDGLYIAPNVSLTKEEAEKLVGDVNKNLPDGVNLTFGGRYAKMLSYKKKNYALLTYDDKIIIRGSALMSKSIEEYARDFIEYCISKILTDRLEEIPNSYLILREEIINRSIDIKKLAKVEILYDTIENYKLAVAEKRRAKSAAYELAIKIYNDKCPPRTKISYYITGSDPDVKVYENCELLENFNPYKPNYNVAYYLKKLEEYVSRFEVFFSKEDFLALFPTENLITFKIQKPKVINSFLSEEDKY